MQNGKPKVNCESGDWRNPTGYKNDKLQYYADKSVDEKEACMDTDEKHFFFLRRNALHQPGITYSERKEKRNELTLWGFEIFF